eukprot:1155983-Pelagomonas_calceolata.AAC.1
MLVKNVSSAADQLESRAVGQPLATIETLQHDLLVLFHQPPGHNKHELSAYRPQCFHSAALVGGYGDVTLPHILKLQPIAFYLHQPATDECTTYISTSG